MPERIVIEPGNAETSDREAGGVEAENAKAGDADAGGVDAGDARKAGGVSKRKRNRNREQTYQCL